MPRKGENRLTDTGLKRVRLTDGKAVLQDGGGLRATVTTAGDRRVARFVYRFALGDRRHDMRLGTWPDRSLAEIRAARDAARDLVRAGEDPRAAAREAKAEKKRVQAEADARATVGAVFERWDRLHLQRIYKDQGAEVRRNWERDILPTLRDLPIEDLTRAHVAGIVDAALERNAPRTAQTLLSQTRQLCRWAIGRGYLETDPTAALSKASIPVNRPRERVLSDDELLTLRENLPAARLPKWAPPAIWIMLATAVRVGELLRARWQDVDLDAAEWRIPAEHSKNGRAHLVHLSPFAVARFEELRAIQETPWVISGRPKPPATQAGPMTDMKALARLVKDRQRDEALPGRATPHAKRAAEKAARALVLPGGAWTPHDLRRTAATRMQELGVLPGVIERALNHVETNRMVQVYQRAEYLPERRDAFARLGAHLERIHRGEPGNVVAFPSGQIISITNNPRIGAESDHPTAEARP